MGTTLDKIHSQIGESEIGLRSREVGAFCRPVFRYHSLADSNTSWIEVIFHKMKLELLCSNWQI